MLTLAATLDARVLRDDRVLVGSDRDEVLDRIGTFLALRGGDVRAEEIEQRRASWLAGTVEEVAERIRELEAIGVTRVFSSST